MGTKDTTLYIYRDKSYTLSQLAEIAGVSRQTLYYRINHGLTVDEAVNKPLKRPSATATLYAYRGKSYTITQLAKVTGIHASTLYDRLKIQGLSVEEAVNKPLNLPRVTATLYTYRGKSYTMRQLAKVTGVSFATLYTRLALEKLSVDEAVTKPLKSHRGTALLYTYRGKSYTVNQLAEIAGTSCTTMYNRLAHEKLSVEEAVNKPAIQKKPYVYNNAQYTITQLAKITGLSCQTLHDRIERQGLTVDEAVKHHRVTALYTYKGRPYTITQLAKIARIKRSTMRSRLEDQKLSVEEAVNKPLKRLRATNKGDLV